jgi:plastocyanin
MKKPLKRIMKSGLVLACILSLVGIPFASAFAAYEPAKVPKINSFKSNKKSVQPGETVVLKWDTVNATNVEITGIEKGSEEKLPTSGTLEVLPMASTTYTLTATGPGGSRTQSVYVTVGSDSDVTIDYFRTSKNQVNPGETVILSWETTNAQSVSITGLEKESEDQLPLTGSLEVLPTATTTYTLKAYGRNGQEKSSTPIVVNVMKTGPSIDSFTASAYTVTKGQLVTLSWKTSNATECRLLISGGITVNNRQPNGFLSVTPNQTKDYTLVALNAKGEKTEKKITITVIR